MFFTNGSMVQKTTWGDNDTVVSYDRDTSDLGLFDVWKKLAARDPKFGRPEPFISDIEGSGFYTWTATIKGHSKFIDYWSAKTGVSQPLIKNAFTTFKDASWVPTCFVYGTDYYRGQPADVNVMHGYLLWTDRPGDFVKKTVRECTGNEILTEILYHYGLNEDQIKETLKQTYRVGGGDALHHQPVHAPPYRRPAPGHSRRLRESRVHRPVCRDARGRQLHGREFGAHGDDGGVGPDRAPEAAGPHVRADLRRAGHREIARDGGRERHSEPRGTRQSQERHRQVHRETARCSTQAHARARVVLTKECSSRPRLARSRRSTWNAARTLMQ